MSNNYTQMETTYSCPPVEKNKKFPTKPQSKQKSKILQLQHLFKSMSETIRTLSRRLMIEASDALIQVGVSLPSIGKTLH